MEEARADLLVDRATLVGLFKDLIGLGEWDAGDLGTGVQVWPGPLFLGVIKAKTNEPNVRKRLEAHNIFCLLVGWLVC